METSRQRHVVLLISTATTAFLLGAVIAGLAVSHLAQKQRRNFEIPQDQPGRPDDSAAKTDPQHSRALIRVATAEQKPVQPLKPIIGRLVEVRKVTVASEVEGQVVDMPVEEGTPVVGGETVLARVDDVWARLALQRGQSAAASIQARLGYESDEMTRLQQLAEENAISASELNSKKALVKELEADLAGAEATVQEAEQRKTRSVIRAPFHGTVIAKHAELGEHLSPGTPVVDIVSRGTIDARIMVPESLIDLVAVEQALQVRIDPLDETQSGKIVSITPYDASASHTFPVRVRLEDQEGRLKVGMSVTVMVATAPKRFALVVSKDAVLVRPDGATVWVAVRSDTSQAVEVHPVPVVVCTRLSSEYAVDPETSSGRELLSPGAQVVIEGAEHLLPGQHVQIVTLAESLSHGVPGSDAPINSQPSQRSPDAGATDREG